MRRFVKWPVLGLFLTTFSCHASPADTASLQVSLTIHETCLVQSPQQDGARPPSEPQVSCVHDAPHLTRLMTPRAPSRIVAPSEATSMTWLVMF